MAKISICWLLTPLMTADLHEILWVCAKDYSSRTHISRICGILKVVASLVTIFRMTFQLLRAPPVSQRKHLSKNHVPLNICTRCLVLMHREIPSADSKVATDVFSKTP